MRAPLLAAVLAAAGCAPEVIPGAYLCGPEQACPEGQACNGPDAICVLIEAAEPFTCEPPGAQAELTEVEPNDAQATAQGVLVGNTGCVTPQNEVVACAPAADGEDWYRFTTSAACTAVGVEAQIVFSIAFEEVGLELYDSAGARLATATRCANDVEDDATTSRCLAEALTPGASYALRVARTGQGACGGACGFNRYTLSLRLETP